jgi:hypothetical protein
VLGAAPGPGPRQHLARVLQQGARGAVVYGPVWPRHGRSTQRYDAAWMLSDAVVGAVDLVACHAMLGSVPVGVLHGPGLLGTPGPHPKAWQL